MLFFPLVPFQEWILAFSLGLGTFLLLYLAWIGYPKGPGLEKSKPETQEIGEVDHKPETPNNPIPPLLVFIYIGVALWILVYLIFVGLRVKAIG
jgi:hypothetical protein